MTSNPDIFYAKVLLFGEYSIMCGSMALTIPYTHYKGELSFINEDKYTDYEFAIRSNRQLREFYEFTDNLAGEGKLPCNLNLDQFRADLDAGLYFESTIPQGYGVGSSGAVVAAIYQKYCPDYLKHDSDMSTGQLIRLKDIFSQFEVFFHGVSSGMDPLNCYIRRPLLIRSKEEINPVGIPREFSKNGGIFLINSHKTGKTEPLVNWFFDKCKSGEFMDFVKETMIKTTNACIENLISGNITRFFPNLKVLSEYTIQKLSRMVPEEFHDHWWNGIGTGLYNLKLCGSGGGGFILGFSEYLEESRDYFRNHGVEIIPISKFLG